MNLTFRFENFHSFLWMDGHGPYVWACYVVVFITLIILAVEPFVQRKRFIQQQQGIQRRQAQTRDEV